MSGMKKILNIVEIVLIAVGVAGLLYWLLMPGDTNVDFMLYAAYAYVAVAIVAAVVMTAMNMGKSRGRNRIGLYVFGILAVLAVVFWFTLGNADPVVDAGKKVYDNPFILKITDTMIWLAYAGLAAAVLILLAGEIRKALK